MELLNLITKKSHHEDEDFFEKVWCEKASRNYQQITTDYIINLYLKSLQILTIFPFHALCKTSPHPNPVNIKKNILIFQEFPQNYQQEIKILFILAKLNVKVLTHKVTKQLSDSPLLLCGCIQPWHYNTTVKLKKLYIVNPTLLLNRSHQTLTSDIHKQKEEMLAAQHAPLAERKS